MSALAQAVAQPEQASAPAIDIVVRRIHRGLVRTGTVGSTLPKGTMATHFKAGPVMPHMADVMAATTETLTRCAPWLVAYFGPRIFSQCDASDTDSYACRSNWQRLPSGRVEYEHRGLAMWDQGVIMVATSQRLLDVMSTVHHEIWHAVERHSLAADDMAVVDKAVKRGKKLPGHYLSSAVERRARVYENWALARDEGWRPLSILGRPVARLDRIFEYVYSGCLARDRARSGAAKVQGGHVGRALETVYAWPMVLAWPLVGMLAARFIA